MTDLFLLDIVTICLTDSVTFYLWRTPTYLPTQALVDLENSHGEFETTVKEKLKYEQIKDGIKMMKSRDELSENNKGIRENRENS